LRSTYFNFHGNFDEENKVIAMGSPLSPIATNLYMEYFEKKTLESFSLKPKKWKQFVDDTNVAWSYGIISLDDFFNHLNHQCEDVIFMMEIEDRKSIPFLDVLITKKYNVTLVHQVYRKSMHNDRYMHDVNSYHFPRQKIIGSILW
jgi:hypothetical protein